MPPKTTQKPKPTTAAVTAEPELEAIPSTQQSSQEPRQAIIHWKDCVSKTYLLEWLQEPKNFDKWKFSGKQGADGTRTSSKTKKDILKEILLYLQEKGITFRTETMIKNKLADWEAKWKLAHDFLQRTGVGCENDAEKLAVDAIKGKVEKICSDWDALNPIFCQRPGLAPKFVGESGDGATLDLVMQEETPDEYERGGVDVVKDNTPGPPMLLTPDVADVSLETTPKRQKIRDEKLQKAERCGKEPSGKSASGDKVNKKIADTLQRLEVDKTVRNAEKDRHRERKLEAWVQKNDQQFQLQLLQMKLQERKEARKEEELRIRKTEAENEKLRLLQRASPRE